MENKKRFEETLRLAQEIEGRYICSVLDDMRRCVKSLSFGPMKGLIEEAQILANRMETALEAYGDDGWTLKHRLKRVISLKEERDKLKFEVFDLKKTKIMLLEEFGEDALQRWDKGDNEDDY